MIPFQKSASRQTSIAAALFLIIRQINRLTAPKAEAPVAPPEEIMLLREIRDAIKSRS